MTNYSPYLTAVKSPAGLRTSISTDRAVRPAPAPVLVAAEQPEEPPLWVRILSACAWMDCMNPFLITPLYYATAQRDGSHERS